MVIPFLGWLLRATDGCYAQRNSEPSSQTRVIPCEESVHGHLYGLVTLPNGTTVACGSYASDYGSEDGVPSSHCVGFYLPLAALSSAYNLGAYPFGSMHNVVEWKSAVEYFLADIGRWVFEKTPFTLALIGFEVSPDQMVLDKLSEGKIPDERDHGMLWNNDGVLNWYPSTQP